MNSSVRFLLALVLVCTSIVALLLIIKNPYGSLPFAKSYWKGIFNISYSAFSLCLGAFLVMKKRPSLRNCFTVFFLVMVVALLTGYLSQLAKLQENCLESYWIPESMRAQFVRDAEILISNQKLSEIQSALYESDYGDYGSDINILQVEYEPSSTDIGWFSQGMLIEFNPLLSSSFQNHSMAIRIIHLRCVFLSAIILEGEETVISRGDQIQRRAFLEAPHLYYRERDINRLEFYLVETCRMLGETWRQNSGEKPNQSENSIPHLLWIFEHEPKGPFKDYLEKIVRKVESS
ncbi:MAG: hypothetical protein HS116_26345 [Planctomycetes bacterium]|nr:hypothetical protein [Planctomycetota bacterium]